MATRKFGSTISASIKNILADVHNGKFAVRCQTPSESNLFGDGVSVFLGEDRVLSSKPRERNIVTMSPRASILIKKKAFSTFKHVNDLQWMDRTEKMLLRTTKALFAYKVAQIRAYESLTKVEDIFEQTSEISLSIFAELLQNAQFLTADSDIDASANTFNQILSAVGNTLADAGYDDIKEDVLMLLERNVFASDLSFTTWIVDPNATDNYETGPGTGVIEIGMYSSFTTQLNLNTEPSSADFTLEDPYRIMNITESDIEIAIQEALVGTLGLLSELSNPDAPQVDAKSAVSAGLEIFGLGNLDSTIDADYIRDRMRVFYLGKPFINAGDGVHFFIRGNKTVQDFSNQEDVFDRGFLSVDETIFEAERILFTKGKLNLETYKNLRQFSDNSFGMRHVFGGYVTRISETWGSGKWTMKVNCTDNMGWLQWSRFMIEPALQDPQGILEDPLTPYELKTDATGAVLSAGGPQLLEENKELIRSGLLVYDSGILNGQSATENNLLQGQYNKSGSLSGTKVLQHPHGLIYRWKTGVITATASINTTDPLNEGEVTQALHNQTYGLTVAQDVLNNLDIANILSLLIVGQPYNVETFVDQAYQAHNISRQGASAALNNTDPLAAVLNVVRRQNNHFGNFRPYRMVTMSSQTLLQTANSNILRNGLNENIRQLQTRRAQLDALIRRLTTASSLNGNNLLLNSLSEERRSIESGIKNQIQILKDSGQASSIDIITQNFNLFGQSKTLPLTGNYTADHQTTRAMTIVGAQRRIEDVRLNRDQNLFIVSDQYDEQTDIRPFIFKLRDADYKIFKGDFISVYDKCSEAAKFINLEFFCLAGDTPLLVKKQNGHIESQYIKDFVNGDMVLSPDQNGEISWKKASCRSRNLTEEESMYNIRFGTGTQIKASNYHRFLDNNLNELRVEDMSVNSRIGTADILPNNEEDLSIDLATIFKNYKFYRDNGDNTFNLRRNKNIPNKIELDEEFAWLLGLWVAEGSISTPKNRKNKESRGYQTSFALHENEENIADKLISIISSKLNVKGHKYVYPKYTRCSAVFSNIIVTNIIENIFGYKNAHSKSIPSLIWNAKSNIKKAFLSGLFIGDAAWNRRISLSSKSTLLLNDVHQLLLMIGIKSTICKYDKINIYGKENLSTFLNYIGDWHHYDSMKKYCEKGGENKNRKITDNKKIKSIERISFDKKVYDLTVEDNHTFIVGSILSHNCNSQGHLEFRPPQWNKTPLTVLQRLFEINEESGRKLVPEFLTEVFQTRSDSLRREIHSLNIRIVLLSLLLNSYPDKSLIPNFNPSASNDLIPSGTGTGKASLKFFGVNLADGDAPANLRDGRIQFGVGNAVDTGNQVLGNGINIDAGLGKKGDLLNGDTLTLLGNFDPIFQESVGLVNNVLNTAVKSSSESAIKIANAANLNAIRESFTKLSGIDPATGLVSDNGKFQSSDFIFNNDSTSQNAEAESLAKANNYLKKLEETISKRDGLVTILQRNLKKEQELDEVEGILSGEFTEAQEENDTGFLDTLVDRLDQASNTIKTITDVFTGDANQGTLFDHLIADDTRNFLGPGSGKRYIIHDHDIISCTFTEEPPDFVRVDIVGDAPIVGAALNRSFQDRYYWAGATDFDLWRQYGYKSGGTKNLPFANDAELQSKPYAILELQLQRLKINQGTITIVGNEYYEPGDTVYVPTKELLYYVRSVSHNYDLGEQFTTSLTLEFGHPPGTYLPSPLDIIGQQFTKDPLTGTILTYRNSQGDDSYRALQPDSAIVFPNNQEITEDTIPVLLDHKDNAVRFTNMMADLSSILIGDRIVLIRGFVKGRNDPDEETVRNNINIIKTMLQNPVSLTQTNSTSISDDIFDIASQVGRGLGQETGTTKGVTPMVLPNGLTVNAIPATKIAEQIVFIDNEGSTSEIQCLNPELLTAQSLDSKLVDSDEYESVFPKGGPKQRTWLDIKSESKTVASPSLTTFKVSNVIEIGILDIKRAVKTGIKKDSELSVEE